MSAINDTTETDIKVEEYSVIRKKISIDGTPNQKVTLKMDEVINIKVNGYPNLAGSFILKDQQVNYLKEYFMIDGGINNKKEFTKYAEDLVRENFKIINNVCSINITSYAYTINNTAMRIYGKCIYEKNGCRKYKFHLYFGSSKWTIEVFANSEKILHPKFLKVQQVRGVRRIVAKNSIKNQKPSNYRNNLLISQSRELRKVGNVQDVPSKDVARKIKSEVLQKQCRKADVVWDLILMQRDKNWNYFLKRVSVPQEIYLFSYEQLKLASNDNNKLIKRSRNTLFIDATGGIVKKFDKNSKRVFLYTILMHVPEEEKKGLLIPIGEALLARHYENDIRKFFMDVKVYSLENKIKWPLSRRICVDWSWALINAAIKSFNNFESVSNYLIQCDTILQNIEKISPKFVVIQICCSHFFKINVKDIEECSQNPEQVIFFRKMMIRAINICHIEEFWVWFKNATIILLSKYINNEVNAALDYFVSPMFNDNEPEVSPKTIKNNNDRVPQYQRSPFYKKALDIYHSMKVKQSNTGMSSNWTNSTFFNIILKKYIPYIAFWTNIMGFKIDSSGKTRISNAPVESYFNINKNITLEGKRHVRPSVYVRSSKRYIHAKLKEIENMVNLTEKKATKKRKAINEELIEDIWKSTPKIIKLNMNLKEMNAEKCFKMEQSLVESLSNKKIPNIYEKVRIILYEYDHIFKELKKEIPIFSRAICLHDFQSLNPRKEIYNSIIDLYSSFIFFKHKILNCDCLPVDIGIGVFIDKTITNINQIHLTVSNKLLIMPIHKSHHFTFVFVNFDKKDFYYIDPMIATERESKNKFNTFLNLFNHKDKWNLKQVAHYKQTDSYNCGILCLQFMEALLTNQSLTGIINPDKYRTIIKNELVEYGNMNMKCMHCENGKMPSVVNCIKCKRGIDEGCFKYLNETLNIKMSQPFICFICQK